MKTLYDQLPWQQGLKHNDRLITIVRGYLYDQLPWQQGLKLSLYATATLSKPALWPTSMTTRIETLFPAGNSICNRSLWPTSMTTRIETKMTGNDCRAICGFMTNFHDNKDWNKENKAMYIKPLRLYDQLPWQQGLKLSYPKQWTMMVRFMTNFHDNKDWNWSANFRFTSTEPLYDQLPWQQGLKRHNQSLSVSFQ